LYHHRGTFPTASAEEQANFEGVKKQTNNTVVQHKGRVHQAYIVRTCIARTCIVQAKSRLYWQFFWQALLAGLTGRPFLSFMPATIQGTVSSITDTGRHCVYSKFDAVRRTRILASFPLLEITSTT